MRDSVIADVKILPIGTESAGVSRYIASCIDVLRGVPDINYRINAMSTEIEGPLDRVLELVRQMHEIPFLKGVERVYTTVSIDDRRDKQITLESKVAAVERRLEDMPEDELAGIIS